MAPVLTFGLALLAGAALPFAMAPYGWWPLAIASVAALYVLLRNAPTPRAGVWIGYCHGVGYFGAGVYWIYHSLHLFGAAIAPLAALMTVVFVLLLSLCTALMGWGYVRLRLTPDIAYRGAYRAANRTAFRAWLDPVVFAGIWALVDLLRSVLFGGFPWNLIGYSISDTPLSALAPIVGVYGIGFLLVWASASLVSLRWRGLIVPLVLVGAALGLSRVSWSQPTGEPVSMRLVQASIPQQMKFSQERLDTSLQQYTRLTLDALPDETRMVIWPETAIPTTYARVDDWLAPFVESLRARGVDVISGGFFRDEQNRPYNSVRQLGGERALYRKHHLVPFGEYMPMRFILDFAARFIDIPMSDLTEGPYPPEPFVVQGLPLGVSICYEDVYGEEMRYLLPEAQLLVNVSNDAWFGRSSAPWQHEQKARFRAMEFARPLVRVTNTGVTSAIDHHGRVMGRLGLEEVGVLDVAMQPREGATPYARTGNWPVFLLCLTIALGSIMAFRSNPGRGTPP